MKFRRGSFHLFLWGADSPGETMLIGSFTSACTREGHTYGYLALRCS